MTPSPHQLLNKSSTDDLYVYLIFILIIFFLIVFYRAVSLSSATKQLRKHQSKDSNTFVPPRSKEFYRVGPEFNRTTQTFELSDPNKNPLYTIISARIDRGFQKSDDETWLSYRRNYFTLVASFSLVEKNDIQPGKVPPFPVYLTYDNTRYQVRSFSIRLTAFKVLDSGESEEIALIQHTAKRYKGPRQPPSVVSAVPGVLPDHAFIRDNANYRSSAQLQKVEPFFFCNRSLIGPFAAQYPEEKIAHVVLFDRVQFTPAGGGGSQTCKAVVQLIAELDGNVSYVIAHCETPSFTLRNRSPGNYFEDGTLIPRSRKAVAALAASNRSFTTISENLDNENSTNNNTKSSSEEKNCDSLANVYNKINETQVRLKKALESKRKNSFVTERPDFRVARLSYDAVASENTRQNLLITERENNIGGTGEFSTTTGVSTGFNHVRFGNTEFPKLEIQNVTNSIFQQDNSTGSAVLEKRKRGRPKATTKKNTFMSASDSKQTQNNKQSTDSCKKELNATGTTLDQQLLLINQFQNPQILNDNDDKNNDHSNDDDDDTDDSEDYEELRKRDMMRLRSRSITSSIHDLKETSECFTSKTITGTVAKSNDVGSSSNKVVQPVKNASTISPTTVTPSRNFEFQSPIGRALPSASRETHGPNDGSYSRESRRSSRHPTNFGG